MSDGYIDIHRGIRGGGKRGRACREWDILDSKISLPYKSNLSPYEVQSSLCGWHLTTGAWFGLGGPSPRPVLVCISITPPHPGTSVYHTGSYWLTPGPIADPPVRICGVYCIKERDLVPVTSFPISKTQRSAFKDSTFVWSSTAPTDAGV